MSALPHHAEHGAPATVEMQQDPLEGALLGGSYRLGSVIAQGGMGVLYAAEHTRLKNALVVKILRTRYATHPIARARFEREALAAAKLDNPHVLRVLDLVTAPDGRPAVVTERLVGEDLQEHLNRRRVLPVEPALAIARQVLVGLQAAHAARVVHRDIKPSNIFLSSSEGAPHVRVLDFGVAKMEDAAEITKAGAVVGTPAYMAPEQAAGRPVDARGDLYALGAVMYRMLSGRPPYTGDGTTVVRRVLSSPPTPLSQVANEVPEAVCEIVEKAMTRAPAGRYANAEEMLAAIDALPAMSAPLSSHVRRLPSLRSYQRARLHACAAALLTLTLTAAVGAAWMIALPALHVPTSLALGAALGAWVAAARRAYRREGQSPPSLRAWAAVRVNASAQGLTLVGLGSLLALVGGGIDVRFLPLCLLPLLVCEWRWWRDHREPA